MNTAPPHVPRQYVSPRIHLRQFTASAAPRVGVLGDSIMCDWRHDSVASCERVWPLLRRAIQRANPDRTISFHNFAIGGATWWVAGGAIPSHMARPGWYDDPTRDWLSYVEAAELDTLIISFGLNDGHGLYAEHVQRVLRTIATWRKVPDILLMTNTARALDRPGDTETDRRGFQTAQALQRTIALSQGAGLGIAGLPPLGLIDAGRYFDIVYLGFDPTDQHLEWTAPDLQQVDGGWRLPATPGGDFSVTLRARGLGAALGAGRVRGLSLSVGHHPDGLNFIVVERSGPAYHVTGYAGSGLSVFDAAGRLSQGDTDLCVYAKQEVVSFEIDGAWAGELRMPRFIAPGFSPTLRFLGEPCDVELIDYAAGHMRTHVPIITDPQMFGEPPAHRLGGGGRVHPSSLGVSTVYAPVIEAVDFAAPNLS